jgi:hypothetical protein
MADMKSSAAPAISYLGSAALMKVLPAQWARNVIVFLHAQFEISLIFLADFAPSEQQYFTAVLVAARPVGHRVGGRAPAQRRLHHSAGAVVLGTRHICLHLRRPSLRDGALRNELPNTDQAAAAVSPSRGNPRQKSATTTILKLATDDKFV